MKPFTRLCLLATFLATGFCAGASAEDLGIIRVDSTTIDDRFEQKRGEPSNIATVSGEEVDASHVENIQQVLQGVPGITTELQAGDSIKIHIRGIENQRFMGEKPGVAIVIDGVPVFERTGRVNIDLDNIESIKVVKGGASYLFGEDALSGAVIITTKRGAKQAGYRVAGEVGDFNYKKGLARAGYAGESSNGHIQASSRSSDGYHFDSEYRADYLDGKWQYYLDDTSDITAGFELSNREKDSHGTVTGVTQAELDPESVEGRDYARMFDVQLEKYFATWSRDFGNTDNWMVNVYQFTDETDFVSAPQRYTATGVAVTDPDAYTTQNDYFQTQRGLKSEYRSGGESLAWLGALDLRFNTYENRTLYLTDFKTSRFSPTVYTAGTVTGDNTTDERVTAVYGELKFQPAQRWTTTLNGRYDLIELDYTDDLSDLELDKDFRVTSWRGGLNYKVSDTLDVYSNVSTGFRTPTVEQLFAGDIDPTGSTLSNPDLEPEHAVNKEIGLRGVTQWGDLPIDFDMAIFQIDRDDFILSTSGQYATTDTGETNRFENIGGMRNRGFELALGSDKTRTVSFDLAYTYLEAEFTDYDNFNLALGDRYSNPTIEHYDLTGNTVPRAPLHHTNLAVLYLATDSLRVTAEVDATSSYYADELNRIKIDGHEVYNLLANYDVSSGGIQWSWFLRIDNVLDDQYYNTARGSADSDGDGDFDDEDISIVVNPGRVYTVGVSAAF